MRKAISIFFLALFLLYQVGYLGYYWYSSHQIDEKWMSQVEITQDMKHVSIPISLPYWTSQSEYRVTHGKININGELYRKVMQKYEKDAIHLIVAKDTDTEKLTQSIADWVKSMTDSGSSSSDSKTDLLKSVGKDYFSGHSKFELQANSLSGLNNLEFRVINEMAPTNQFPEVNTPPPQV